MQKKIAKGIRVITVAPFMAALLLFLIYMGLPHSFKNPNHYVLMNVVLVLFPLFAYPLQHKYQIIKGEQRESERKLAIIFSLVGYIVGVVLSLSLQATSIERVIYLTYLLSGGGIALLSFVLKQEASGHMCGVLGPIVLLVSYFGLKYLFLIVVPILVVWSSLLLKRHTIKELILGSVVPMIAFVLSVLVITQGFPW